MNRVFFLTGAGVGMTFTIVSSAGLSSTSGNGASFPLNVASENATRRWMKIDARTAQRIFRLSLLRSKTLIAVDMSEASLAEDDARKNDQEIEANYAPPERDE